jgi:hypothetical protein
MKHINRRILVGGAVLAFAGFGLLVFLGQHGLDGGAARQAPSSPELRWRQGASQQYDLLVDSSLRMDASGGGSTSSTPVRLEGVAEFHTLETGPAGALVGMQLLAVDLMISGVSRPEVNRALTLPFRVRFTPDGIPTRFEFSAPLTADLRTVIENLVRNFQVTLRGGESWLAQESHAYGVYEAAYKRVSAALVEKTKKRYLDAAAGEVGASLRIDSTEWFRIDPDSDWITAMTVDETVKTMDSGGISVEITNHATLELRTEAYPSSSTGPDTWKFVAADPQEVDTLEKVEAPSLTVEEAERQLASALAELDAGDGDRGELIHQLRDLVLLDGSLPFFVLDIMREQDLADETRAALYLVLQLAGSPEAQGALGSAVTDTTLSPSDAIRALVALGGVENPTDDALALLWYTASTDQTGSDRSDLASTATLALGRLANGLHGSDAARYYTLRANLLAGVNSGPNTHQRAVHLHALGNAGDPALKPDIIPFLDDPAPVVRSAAAQTLGRLGPDDVADELLQRFDKEESSLVRGAIVEALVSWEQPSPDSIESMRSAIRQETDADARYNMARFLGNNLEAFPDNSVVLQEVLRYEQSSRIRHEISAKLASLR